MSEDTAKYKLPESWIWTNVVELGIVISGGTPATKNPSFGAERLPGLLRLIYPDIKKNIYRRVKEI